VIGMTLWVIFALAVCIGWYLAVRWALRADSGERRIARMIAEMERELSRPFDEPGARKPT